jgi:hypothetical protein
MAARYPVELTDEQRQELAPSCCWDVDCGQPTVGLRRDSKDSLWYSVCLEHVRMGNTVILGVEGVLVELLVSAGR